MRTGKILIYANEDYHKFQLVLVQFLLDFDLNFVLRPYGSRPRTFSVPGCQKLMFIFSRKIEAIVFINVQIFCKAREKMFGEYRLGDILGYHLVLTGVFDHVAAFRPIARGRNYFIDRNEE